MDSVPIFSKNFIPINEKQLLVANNVQQYGSNIYSSVNYNIKQCAHLFQPIDYFQNEETYFISKRPMSDSDLEAELGAFFPSNKKLLVYNLTSFNNSINIYHYCRNKSRFVTPLVMCFNEKNEFLNIVILSFSNVSDCTKAFMAFNSNLFPMFAQFGNPNISYDSIDKTKSKIYKPIATNKLMDKQDKFTHSRDIPTNISLSMSSQESIYIPRKLVFYKLESPLFGSKNNSNKIICWLTLPIVTMWINNQLSILKNDPHDFLFRVNKFIKMSLIDVFTLLSQKHCLMKVVGKTFLTLTLKISDKPSIESNYISNLLGDKFRRVLTVSAKTQVKAIAGAIAHTLRKEQCPVILSGGAEGINLTVKAIAISLEYLIDDQIGLYCFLEKSNGLGGLRFVVIKDRDQIYQSFAKETTVNRSNNLLKISKHSKVHKIANLIYKQILKNGSVSIGSMGSNSVFQTVKAIILAGKYLQRHNHEISFQPRFVSLLIGDHGNEKRSVLKIIVKSEEMGEV